MRGIPEWFNSFEDVMNSMEVDKEATKTQLQTLLDARMVWCPVGRVADASAASPTVRVVPMQDGEAGGEYLMQYELREDPGAWMYRIGLDVAKINALLEA